MPKIKLISQGIMIKKLKECKTEKSQVQYLISIPGQYEPEHSTRLT